MEPLDWMVMGLYAAVVLIIGWRVGRGHQSEDELFLGGRRVPVWAAFLSMVATELSAATYIGVPVASYGGDWSYLQFAFGALAGKIVLATWFISRYHKMKLVTVYGFLEHRFGRKVELMSSWMFLIGRIFASGSRLFIGALAFATVTGFSMEVSIVAAGVVAGVYTLFGGIRAVIWTDTLQGATFVVGAVTALFILIGEAPAGVQGIMSEASDLRKTEIFHFPSLTSGGTSAAEIWGAFLSNYVGVTSGFFVALFGGFFLTMASHGTDQDMVQRLLTTRDGKRGGWALVGSALTNFPISALFLLLGTSLWVFYRPDIPDHFTAYEIGDKARVFPRFVLNEVPVGLRGLIFSGLFAAAMSSMDSALNSLATTWVVNIRSGITDARRRLFETRLATVICGVLLIGAALGCVIWHERLAASGFSLIDVALGSMTVLYGGLLGAFLVGMMSRRGNEVSILTGMGVSSGLGVLLLLQPLWTASGKVEIAWPWWIILGTIVSFVIGIAGPAPRNTSASSPKLTS